MPISTSLRPAVRALLAVATLAGGALALPAAAPAASAETAIAPTAVVKTVSLESATARLELRQQRRSTVARKALHAFHIGLAKRGAPYVWGASGPNAFDCSGLTSYAYHHAGLRLPRTAAAQAGAVRHIPRAQMLRGDLVFFSNGGHVYHVGMFAGRRHGTDYILQSPRRGQRVQVVPIWTNRWFGGAPR
jgi:cell wall-associated NlpC family hydrolase